jgi:hypothetical protein
MASHDDPLMVGMFWAGLLVASVPILLTLGVGVYVLRRYLEERRHDPRKRSPEV